jgi:hypothetical protein
MYDIQAVANNFEKMCAILKDVEDIRDYSKQKFSGAKHSA